MRIPYVPVLLAVSLLLSPRTVSAADRRSAPPPDNVLTVTVRGEVAVPGRHTLAAGERISGLLRVAGGLTERAFLPGAALVRESEKIRRRAELSAWKDRLERMGHPLARWIGTQDASGRLAVAIDHPRLLKGAPADIPLEDGDLLFVPPTPSFVRVTGAVLRASDVPCEPRKEADHYIRAAGGAAKEGDPDRVLLRKSDGRVAVYRREIVSWSEERRRWEIAPWGGPRETIGPGDLLYVPVVAACGPEFPGGTSWTDVLRAILSIVEEPPPPLCGRDPGKEGRAAP